MELIDLSDTNRNDVDFYTFIDGLCATHGFDYASYATTSPVTGAVQGYTNFPDEWKLYYMKRGLHRIDPTLHSSARSIAPVDWSRFERNEKFRAIFYAAEDFGISSQGLTVPVRGPLGETGLLSVTKSCRKSVWERHIADRMSGLQLAAVHLHDSVMQSDILTRAVRQPTLSARETEVLQWVAAGKSQQDIGIILSISNRTVEVHLRSAREKLAAMSTAQAVARAIGLRLIHPM